MPDLRHTIADVRADGQPRSVRCPAHEDRRASLSVGRGDGDRVLLNCHAGCETATVLEAVGLAWKDLMPPTMPGNGTRLGRLVATYDYTDETGTLLYQVCRYEPKTFRQRRPDGNGGWIQKLDQTRRVLFGLPTLHGQLVVYVPEGEKDVLALREMGLAATCNAGGAGKWRPEYVTQLTQAGVTSVVALPDHDEAGRVHAETVARTCHTAGLRVKYVELPGLAEKGDVSAWIAAGHTHDELVTLVKATPLSAPRPSGAPSRPIASALAGDHDDDAEFARAVTQFAALSPPAYDRCRTDEAARLGVRTSTLDQAVKATRASTNGTAPHGRALAWPEVDPWAEDVDGATLLREIADLVRTYVSLSAALADTVALWIVMTWLHDALELSTFLNVTSPTKRCGKTLLLDVMAALVHHPMPTNNMTTAALFRVIEQRAPTLLLDEADRTFAKQDIPDLLAVLNGSQRRECAFVLRCVGDDHEVRQFRTWCPKALVGIGDLPDTVMDRSVVVRLERRPPGADVPLWRDRDRAAITRVRRQIARWTADHTDAILTARTRVPFPAGLHDRARDGWEALLAIGEVAGGDWAGAAGRAHQACAHVTADMVDDAGAREMLLADLRVVFQDLGDPEALPTKQLLDVLHGMDGRPWSEWRRGKPLSSRGLSTLLQPFKVRPVNIRLPDGTVPKGYRSTHLAPVWRTYLPQEAPVGGGSIRYTATSQYYQ